MITEKDFEGINTYGLKYVIEETGWAYIDFSSIYDQAFITSNIFREVIFMMLFLITGTIWIIIPIRVLKDQIDMMFKKDVL